MSSNTSDSSSSSSNSNSHGLLIAGVILGLFGAIGVGIIIWWTRRMKPRVPYEEDEPSKTQSQARDDSRAHSRSTSISTRLALSSLPSASIASNRKSSAALASKITPFNPSSSSLDLHGTAPRFIHTPGANMRIATRLSNGVWQFSEPQRGFLGQLNTIDSTTPTSLQLQALLDQRTRAPSPSPSPSSPYPPTSGNPFADFDATAAARSPIHSPIENPFSPHPDQDTNTKLDTSTGAGSVRVNTEMQPTPPPTSFKPYPFTRPSALSVQTQTQTQSVYRGTIYDLQRIHSLYSKSLSSPNSSSPTSASALIPAGIHDLDVKKGKPLPVVESELMRRGLAGRNSIGAQSSLEGPSRQNSEDSTITSISNHSTRSRRSAGSQVLLGGTGPVGIPLNGSSGSTRTKREVYHPDLDNVLEIQAPDPARTAEKSGTLRQPISGSLLPGPSPYRDSEVYTFIDGYGNVTESDSQPHSHSYEARPMERSHTRMDTTTTSESHSYPETIPSSSEYMHGSGLGLLATNPYSMSTVSLAASTVYRGSLGHFTRERGGSERASEDGGMGEEDMNLTVTQGRLLPQTRSHSHSDSHSFGSSIPGPGSGLATESATAPTSVVGHPGSPTAPSFTSSNSNSMSAYTPEIVPVLGMGNVYRQSRTVARPNSLAPPRNSFRSHPPSPSAASFAGATSPAPSAVSFSTTLAHTDTEEHTMSSTLAHTQIHSEGHDVYGYGYGYGRSKDAAMKKEREMENDDDDGIETETETEAEVDGRYRKDNGYGYGFSNVNPSRYEPNGQSKSSYLSRTDDGDEDGGETETE